MAARAVLRAIDLEGAAAADLKPGRKRAREGAPELQAFFVIGIRVFMGIGEVGDETLVFTQEMRLGEIRRGALFRLRHPNFQTELFSVAEEISMFPISGHAGALIGRPSGA